MTNQCDYCKKDLTPEQDYPWQFGHHFCDVECYHRFYGRNPEEWKRQTNAR